MKRGVVTILSVDGGGVRGLVPALIVRDLMRRIGMIDGIIRRRIRRTRREPDGSPVERRLWGRLHAPGPTVADIFDFFAGTSTGALLALGFAKENPYTADDIAETYRRHSRTIFPISRFASVRAMRQAFAEKYDALPLESVLEDLFGDQRLQDCTGNVLVTAYDTDNRGPYFFKHYTDAALRKNRALREKHDPPEDFFLKDVARATSAAPTFFQGAEITSLSGRKYSFLDGGLVANNPALSAYVEARKIWRHARRYVILSIGTGRSGRRFAHDAIRKWGYLDWVSPVQGVPMLSFMMDGQSESAAHALKNLPRIDYYRINFDIDVVSEEMDDARPENIAAIEAMAGRVIKTHSADLHRLAKVLYQEWRRRHGLRGPRTASR
ncbi:MAG: patatin-like phospholipase family protein [Alkalispirochaeta sp.]